MSDKENQIEQNTNDSITRRQALTKEFVAYEFEYETGRQVAKMRKKLKESSVDKSPTIDVIVDCDNIYIQGSNRSVGSIIKTKAVNLRPYYHSLTVNNKAIVSLGLNSIIDLSFTYPDSQSTLFTNQQWNELRKRYKPKKYNANEYNQLGSILSPIFETYNEKKTFQVNWINIYKQIKLLEQKYDSELESNYTDISFCIYFMLQLLLLIKHQPGLFKEEIDCSEWDYIVKFWGVITERLFYTSNLRLKWGDTHLTLHDTISDARFKVDMRIINDKIKQRYNTENDVSIMEAAEEYPGDIKFVSDRCKLSIENKSIIDRFLLDGVKITSIDSLQISGLDVHFINTCLEERGLYITNEFKQYKVGNAIKNLKKYMNLAVDLLCFRDECIFSSNKYDEHLVEEKSKKKSSKRSIDDLQDDELTVKQESIRGSWFPPRNSKSPPPEVPKCLYKDE